MTTTNKRLPVNHILQWERSGHIQCKRVRSRRELAAGLLAIASEIQPGKRAAIIALGAAPDPSKIVWGSGSIRIDCYPATALNLRSRPHDRIVSSTDPPATSVVREGKAAAQLRLDGEIRDVS
jgi:hypothetical protein